MKLKLLESQAPSKKSSKPLKKPAEQSDKITSESEEQGKTLFAVVATLGVSPSCFMFEDRDGLVKHLREHITKSIPDDVRVYVFEGRRVPITHSIGTHLDPHLVFSDTDRVRILSNEHTDPSQDQLISGSIKSSLNTEVTITEETSEDNDLFF